MMMRVLRAAVAASVLAAAVACESDSPTGPSETHVFTATLVPSNEVPPVTNAQSVGSGTVVIQLAVTRDGANAITAATYFFSVDLNGFPAGTSLTGAHIHRGVAGVNGPVIVNTGLATGEFVLDGSNLNFVKTNTNAALSVATEILANPSGYYFNVHSTLSPGGVARGQLVKM